MDYRKAVLALYEPLPFHKHPLWQAIFRHELSLSQILAAEKQHYLRTRGGQALRQASFQNAPKSSPRIFEAALNNYLEEVVPDQSEPSHLQLIKRLLIVGGVDPAELESTIPTPGNAAAMALYRDIAARGPACHLVGAGAVEYYYSKLSPDIYRAYISFYGMSSEQAKTYEIHGPMDAEHAERALAVLDEAVALHGWDVIELAVRDAFAATSLHYDGMYQAAQGRITYWDGGLS